MDRRGKGKRSENSRDSYDKSSHYKHDKSTQPDRHSKSSESKSQHGDDVSNGEGASRSERNRDKDDKSEKGKIKLRDKPQGGRDTRRSDRDRDRDYDRRDSYSRGGEYCDNSNF